MGAIIGKSHLAKIPHEGGEIIFRSPSFKGTYGQVAEAIDREGLERPTSPEIASLVYEVWKNKDRKFESEIIYILGYSGLWEFTGNLSLPKKEGEEVHNGVILEHNPKIINRKLHMDKKGLIERLKKNDPLVKFVPFGFKTSFQTLFEIKKNPYIVARYGIEGAEKLAEVASNYSGSPEIRDFDFVDKEKVMISSLICFNLRPYGLLAGGESDYINNRGFAVGIVPKKTATAASV